MGTRSEIIVAAQSESNRLDLVSLFHNNSSTFSFYYLMEQVVQGAIIYKANVLCSGNSYGCCLLKTIAIIIITWRECVQINAHVCNMKWEFS